MLCVFLQVRPVYLHVGAQRSPQHGDAVCALLHLASHHMPRVHFRSPYYLGRSGRRLPCVQPRLPGPAGDSVASHHLPVQAAHGTLGVGTRLPGGASRMFDMQLTLCLEISG